MARSINRVMVGVLATTVLAVAGCSSADPVYSSARTQSESRTPDSAAVESQSPVAGPQAGPEGNSSDPDTGDSQPVDDGTTADRVRPVVRPRRNGNETERITFDDLKIEMPVDSAFDPLLLTDRAKELDQQRVKISGFIAPTIFQAKGIKSFPMLRNLECKFGPGGQAFCVIVVELKDGVTTDFTTKPITVEGLLKIQPFDGPDGITYALYHLDGDKVF